jgi:hypothetical protein
MVVLDDISGFGGVTTQMVYELKLAYEPIKAVVRHEPPSQPAWQAMNRTYQSKQQGMRRKARR